MPRSLDPRGDSPQAPLMVDLAVMKSGAWGTANHLGKAEFPDVCNVVHLGGHAESYLDSDAMWWGWSGFEWYWAEEVDDIRDALKGP